MIDINLVSANLRKKDAGSGILQSIALPREILFGIGSLFLLALILVHILLAAAYAFKFSENMIYKMTWERLLPEKKNIDTIGQELKGLKGRMATITDLTSKKAAVSSAKLNILSDVMPKGVWLKKIVWDGTSLVIEGSAYSKFHDEIITVGNYVSNIKKNEMFAKDFASIELNSATRSKRGQTEVVDFKITARTTVPAVPEAAKK